MKLTWRNVVVAYLHIQWTLAFVWIYDVYIVYLLTLSINCAGPLTLKTAASIWKQGGWQAGKTKTMRWHHYILS